MTNTAAFVDCLFVFNATFSKREDDTEEMMMFYYPEDLHIGRKLRNIGLAQGMINFTRTFSPDKPCEVMRTLKRTQVYYEAEPEYWMIFAVAHPTVKVKRNGKIETKYLDTYFTDETIKKAIQRAYSMFRMLHGEYTQIVSEKDVETLREITNAFFTKYLRHLDLDSNLNFINSFNGITFLPVDKNIKETIFLYKDQLVWSGLEQEVTNTLYHFLKTFIISSTVDNVDEFISCYKNSNGFMTGPKDLDDARSVTVPSLFIGNTSYYLILYRRKDICCAFLLETKPSEVEFFRALDKFIVPQIDHLEPIISDFYSSRRSSDESYRYIYFNHMNLAIKSTIKGTLNHDILEVLGMIHEDFVRSKDNVHEQIMSLPNGVWILGKKSEDREIYLLFEDKREKLTDVHEEFRKLSSSVFGNLFMDC